LQVSHHRFSLTSTTTASHFRLLYGLKRCYCFVSVTPKGRPRSSFSVKKGTVLAVGERRDMSDEEEPEEEDADEGMCVLLKKDVALKKNDVSFLHLSPQKTNVAHTPVTLSLKAGLSCISS